MTKEDLKKIREYIFKKDKNVKNGYCNLGYFVKGELKFFDITIKKEKQELTKHLEMEHKLDKIKDKINELQTKISKIKEEAYKVYDEINKDFDWQYHYDQIYFATNAENDKGGRDIVYMKEIKDGLLIGSNDLTYKYYEKPSKEILEEKKQRIYDQIVHKFMSESPDYLEYGYWRTKIYPNIRL
jgi:hypothetical protein